MFPSSTQYLLLNFPTRYAVSFAIFLILPWGPVANADVFTVGAVSPVPPVAGGVFSSFTELSVGTGNDNTENNIWGFVSVDDGTLLQYGRLIVGDEDGFFGNVGLTGNFLTGVITQVNFSASGSANNPTIQVGNQGTGWLNLSGGSMLTTTNSSGNMSIGRDFSGVGYATVTDQFTLLTVEDSIFVGQNGIGTLDVLQGAIVRTIDRGVNQFVGIGTNAFGVGRVVVDGQGSVLRSASSLVVSGNNVSTPTEFGQGTLRISNGGIVDVDNGTNPRINVGPLGRIELAGGTLIGFTPLTGFGTTVRGYLGGSGLVRGSVGFAENAIVEANPGDLLRFSGPVENQGSITVDRGEVWFLNDMTNNAPSIGIPPGRISLENGTVRFSQQLINNGVISSASGSNNIHGEIINNERVIVARDTVATFFDFFDPSIGIIDVLPGGNALFLADLTFQAASVLQVGVGAASLADTQSPITAGGLITLAGALSIDLDPSYTPALGQSFQLLSADSGIMGTFDSISLPALPGELEFGILYQNKSVIMEVRTESLAVGLPGDYNNDGIVDAGDFTVWRSQLGSPTALPNDDTPGVGQDDYNRWKAYFGQTAGAAAFAGGGSFVPTPEPTGLLLLLIMSIALLLHSHRQLGRQIVAS